VVVLIEILILEINGLRLAYSLQHADCAGAVFYSVMKSALVAAQSTNAVGWRMDGIQEGKSHM